VTPASTEAWKTVIGWVSKTAGVPVEFIEHAPPKLLSDLWSRSDLGMVQMCGLPASLRSPAPTILAAPQPSLPRYGGKSVYMSDLAVRADSKFQKLEDTFGGVAGYTLKDSQSGYFAFRYFLMTKHPQAKYRKIVGGLLNARGIVKALVAGDIDVGPLDGYVWDLIRAGDPEFSAQVRLVAATDPTPMPPLISTGLNASEVDRVRTAFLGLHQHAELDAARRALFVDRFIVPDLSVYDETKRRAHLVEKEAEWP
jgi:ABC-type phosphate/phosphonate transport system substrate-binding protein